MNVNEILRSPEVNLTITMSANDLRQFATELIQETKRGLEAVVLDEKAETYPTVKQVSEMLNVTLPTLWRWNKAGYLQSFEFGGGKRYRMSDVKRILDGGKKVRQ